MLALALASSLPAAMVSAESATAESPTHELDVLGELRSPHPIGWVPDDELSVTALERFADLLPNVRQIAGAPEPENVLELTVDEVIRMTLENSSDIEQARFTPRIRAHAVEQQRGSIFDTELSASVSYGVTDSPDSSGRFSSHSRSDSYRAGLSQRLATGGLVDLSYSLSRSGSHTRSGSHSESWNNSVALDVTQPLLRGFGPMVTRAPITTADLSRQASEQDFRNTVIDTVAGAMNTHWDLFFAWQQAQVQLISLDQAREVLNNNRIRLEVGDMTRAEVLQAESIVAQREGNYFSALRTIQDTEDALWLQIDRSGLQRRWDTEIIPADAPVLERMDLSEEQLIALAYQNRPDLIAAQLRRDSSEISRRLATNSLLPRLDLSAGLGFMGVGGEASRALDNMGTMDFEDWAVGLTFSYPLQNRAARHSLRQAELSLEQAEVGLTSQRLRILLEIRNTLRQLQNATDLLAAREAEVRARELELRDEQRRYEVGLSTTEILLRFQNDLASARISRLSSVVSYVQAIISLDQATGTLLEKHGIVIEPVDITVSP
ncbi:TolC family protein [Candidatus Sumerlaeota bacterium]|nr:TolC family protein [Candidatus Sumerlaeota bacterium]